MLSGLFQQLYVDSKPFVLTEDIWQEHTRMLQRTFSCAFHVEDLDLAHDIADKLDYEWQSLPDWQNTTAGIMYFDSLEGLQTFKEHYTFAGGVRTL